MQAKETAQIPWIFRKAFKIAREGRPGPVLIDLPLNVTQGQEVEYDPELDGRLSFETPEPNPDAIRRAVEMILEAERPMLMPGGGVMISEAWEELVELAEYLQVPVTPTYMGKGVIREDHPLYAGIVGIQTNQRWANALFLESDLVVGIGNRWAERHTGDPEVYMGERKFVHIDIDPFQLGRVIPPDLGIVSDATLALKAMRSAAEDMTEAREPGSWVERVDDLRSTMRRKMDFDDVPIKPQRVFKEINEFFDEDTIFVTAIGLYQIWSGQFQDTYKPRHYLCCGQAGPLGWEVPACIGAKLGKPDNLIVGVVGDYTFQFLEEEIAVAVQYRVPYVLVRVNNAYASLIRQPEDTNYDMDFAVDFSYEGPEGPMGVDFVALIEAIGALGRRVTKPDGMKEAFQWTVEASQEKQVPALVEVIVERETDASMGGSIDTINEFEPVEESASEPSDSIPQRD